MSNKKKEQTNILVNYEIVIGSFQSLMSLFIMILENFQIGILTKIIGRREI